MSPISIAADGAAAPAAAPAPAAPAPAAAPAGHDEKLEKVVLQARKRVQKELSDAESEAKSMKGKIDESEAKSITAPGDKLVQLEAHVAQCIEVRSAGVCKS